MSFWRQFLSGLQSLLGLVFQSCDAWDLFTVQGDARFETELPSNLNSSLSVKNLNCFCSGNRNSTITAWDPADVVWCCSRLWVFLLGEPLWPALIPFVSSCMMLIINCKTSPLEASHSHLQTTTLVAATFISTWLPPLTGPVMRSRVTLGRHRMMKKKKKLKDFCGSLASTGSLVSRGIFLWFTSSFS